MAVGVVTMTKAMMMMRRRRTVAMATRLPWHGTAAVAAAGKNVNLNKDVFLFPYYVQV